MLSNESQRRRLKRIMTVSYTHLDVYKRQKHCFCQLQNLGQRPKSCHKDDTKRLEISKQNKSNMQTNKEVASIENKEKWRTLGNCRKMRQ